MPALLFIGADRFMRHLEQVGASASSAEPDHHPNGAAGVDHALSIAAQSNNNTPPSPQANAAAAAAEAGLQQCKEILTQMERFNNVAKKSLRVLRDDGD